MRTLNQTLAAAIAILVDEQIIERQRTVSFHRVLDVQKQVGVECKLALGKDALQILQDNSYEVVIEIELIAWQAGPEVRNSVYQQHPVSVAFFVQQTP